MKKKKKVSGPARQSQPTAQRAAGMRIVLEAQLNSQRARFVIHSLSLEEEDSPCSVINNFVTN
jgi:hypothetical protein